MAKDSNDTETLVGIPFSHDRRWTIHTPKFSGIITDYNWELTGFDPRFAKLDKNFVYSGNAYYIIHTLCRRKRWLVEQGPYQFKDRKPQPGELLKVRWADGREAFASLIYPLRHDGWRVGILIDGSANVLSVFTPETKSSEDPVSWAVVTL